MYQPTKMIDSVMLCKWPGMQAAIRTLKPSARLRRSLDQHGLELLKAFEMLLCAESVLAVFKLIEDCMAFSSFQDMLENPHNPDIQEMSSEFHQLHACFGEVDTLNVGYGVLQRQKVLAYYRLYQKCKILRKKGFNDEEVNILKGLGIERGLSTEFNFVVKALAATYHKTNARTGKKRLATSSEVSEALSVGKKVSKIVKTLGVGVINLIGVAWAVSK
jgi:hypothetical protein